MDATSCIDDLNTLSSSSLPSQIHQNDRNVLHLLARREVAPRTAKCLPKRQRGEVSNHKHQSSVKPESERVRNSKSELLSWVEAESLRCLSAKYCPLEPSPRSTIAAAFSADGKILASTHGDHTVKIINCHTGKCEKVLSGHRRTPWVVRFHPLHPEILASGSLDHEVRLWNANTSECIGSRDFYRPIASIAFHAEGELLAVAAGHKLYFWHYNNRGEGSAPAIVLKTRRSLRAVHFHPHSAPFLLTAEVNDLDSSDSTMAHATSLGYLHYPPPTVYMGNMHSIDRLSLAAELPLMHVPLFFSHPHPNTDPRPQLQTGSRPVDQVNRPSDSSDRLQVLANATELYEQMMASVPPSNPIDVTGATNMDIPEPMLSQMGGWELPFMQGWLVGQSQQAGTSLPLELAEGSPAMPYGSNPVDPERQRVQDLSSNGASISASQHRQNAIVTETNGGNDSFPIISRIQSQLSASLTATAAAELPCTVKLRIWPHDFENPCASLKAERCRLTIPHAVLCSEMGAHFSPCGRYLAACVACVLPQFEADPGLPTQLHQERASTSPTRHPISARQVMYELRIYSLEEATFGSVLISRPIRAAHCLTSIQFSPTSEHILLAYGRRHSSLLKSIVINGDTSLSIYTVLEVYRVSDMELVSVLPSAEDEVNVACFHPLAGGGLVYGTKEGKLRILQYDGAHTTRPDHFSEAQAAVEVEP
ncbi:putative transcription factor WD40-like family [Helianthus annuus]|nr:putative transcription factor WD40-like family [Helianthus annuus]